MRETACESEAQPESIFDRPTTTFDLQTIAADCWAARLHSFGGEPEL